MGLLMMSPKRRSRKKKLCDSELSSPSAMFILSDDRRSMTYFCFLTLFKTKNLVYIDGGKSTQSKLMGTFRQDFVSAIRGLAHIIVSTLEIGCLVKPSVFEQYNRELKKLEENLGSVSRMFQRHLGLLGKQLSLRFFPCGSLSLKQILK
ncbi:hypothetical protein DY000_02035443 [Brassica cretica]|uniref:Uncharacterized protein n=1 Tax=Brassica cretica TaxID=69181 RepID=A0ABQ7DXT7_BRACR|nr:hypothetical protein DY000_02035443 [Brassica cretica]